MASGSFYDDTSVDPIEPRREYRTIDSHSLSNSFYKGEGNATLVVALPNEKRVLRLKKSDPKNGDFPADDDGEKRVRIALDFHRNVISRLMGNYAKEPEIVRCNSDDLKSHLRLLELHRPAHRRHKIVIENFATTLPDYALLPAHLLRKIPPSSDTSTFGIEIKPKEEEIGNLALSKCQYCRTPCTENLQLDSCPTTYCARCLFSGDCSLMDRAIGGLVLKPRNKFKIFKNGHYVWGEEFSFFDFHKILDEWLFPAGLIEEKFSALVELIREALSRSFSQSDTGFDYPESSKLPKDSVLERIHRVQTSYRCSIDSIYPIYAKYSSKLNDEMVYAENENIANNEGCCGTPSFRELRDLRNYLVHRISRDCSILMAFREIDRSTVDDVPRENVIRIMNDRYFLFDNAITDLDPKSVHCIEKHHLRSRQISAGIKSRSLNGQNSESTGSADARDKFVNSFKKFGAILALGIIAIATFSLKNKHIEFCLSLNDPDRILFYIIQ